MDLTFIFVYLFVWTHISLTLDILQKKQGIWKMSPFSSRYISLIFPWNRFEIRSLDCCTPINELNYRKGKRLNFLWSAADGSSFVAVKFLSFLLNLNQKNWKGDFFRSIQAYSAKFSNTVFKRLKTFRQTPFCHLRK